MRRFADALYHVTLTLWVGGLWTIGYLVVPTLFAALADRQLAAMLAGKLFVLIGWVGLACAAYLLVFMRWRSGADRPVARTALTSTVTLSSIG